MRGQARKDVGVQRHSREQVTTPILAQQGCALITLFCHRAPKKVSGCMVEMHSGFAAPPSSPGLPELQVRECFALSSMRHDSPFEVLHT